MANCVLCGQKLGMFDKVKIDFHNTKQSVCSDCANRLDNTVGPERAELFRQILDSPYLENGEDIRADINTASPALPAAPSSTGNCGISPSAPTGTAGSPLWVCPAMRWTCTPAPSAARWSCTPPPLAPGPR